MSYQRTVLVSYTLCLLALLVNSAIAQTVAEKSIDQLIAQSSAAEANDRRDAVYELVKRGDTSRAVIDALLVASNDKDVQVRIQGLTGLARAGSAAESAVDTLMQRVDERDNQVRLRAADALGKIGHVAVEPLLQKWPQGSIGFKIAACQAFETMGPVAKPAVPILMQAVESSTSEHGTEPEGRRGRQTDAKGPSSLAGCAARALTAIEPENVDLLFMLADQQPIEARRVGISALAAVSNPAPQVTERLKLATKDAEPQIREVGLIVLAKSNLPTEEKEGLLETALLDSEASVRSAANIALRRARLGGRDFAERLAVRLENADLPTAISVLEALSAVESTSRVGLERIVDCVQRFGIAESTIDSEVHAPAENAEAIEDSPNADKHVPRELVVNVFASMGPEAVSELLEVVSRRPEFEPVVSEALTRIGQPAVEALLQNMQSTNPSIRRASVRAVGAMKPLTMESLERLISSSADPDAELRAAAVAALINFVAENTGAEAAVVRALEDESEIVRAVAMGAMGDDVFSREQRRDGFRRGLNDKSVEVRIAALTAIANSPGQMQRHAGVILELAAAPEDRVRAAALKAMAYVPKEVVDAGQFGEKDIVELVVNRSLKDESPSVRALATGLVPIFEMYSADNSAALIDNLSGSKDLVVATLEVLPKFSAESSSMVERLLPLLSHESSEVRIAAVTALTAVDRDPVRLTAALLPLLDDREWVVRRIAGQTLGRQGSVAVSAVPKLFELLGRHRPISCRC
jgi:HEAT repeat protein